MNNSDLDTQSVLSMRSLGYYSKKTIGAKIAINTTQPLIEKALKENHLIKAHEIFQTLPFQMKEPAINWLGKLSFKIELEKSMQKLIQEKRILTK